MFAQVGVQGWLHAVDLDDPSREVAVDADEPVALASVFKLPLLVALFRQADARQIDLTEQVDVADRTRGGTGLSAMRDPVRISIRDLAFLMISVSDVAATDVLLDSVGIDAVNEMLTGFGMPGTTIRGSCRQMLDSVREDLEAGTDTELAERLGDARAVKALRALDPDRTSAGPPRELTRLLAAIWNDEAAAPDSCAQMRALLGSQVWPHRLAAGFPSDDIAVAGKTGTLPTLRHEVGVVEYPTGARYAVAVFTRSDRAAAALPQVDAAVGATARAAVDDIARRGR